MTTTEQGTNAKWWSSYTEPSTATPRQAAAYARGFLAGRMLPIQFAENACLVIWHLVDNSLRWGVGRIGVSLVLDRDALTITVFDQGVAIDGWIPGRGLRIARELCESVTIARTVGGKAVTALLPYQRDPLPGAAPASEGSAELEL